MRNTFFAKLVLIQCRRFLVEEWTTHDRFRLLGIVAQDVRHIHPQHTRLVSL